MKKILLLFAIMLASVLTYAQDCGETVLNPFTGMFDCVGEGVTAAQIGDTANVLRAEMATPDSVYETVTANQYVKTDTIYGLTDDSTAIILGADDLDFYVDDTKKLSVTKDSTITENHLSVYGDVNLSKPGTSIYMGTNGNYLTESVTGGIFQIKASGRLKLNDALNITLTTIYPDNNEDLGQTTDYFGTFYTKQAKINAGNATAGYTQYWAGTTTGTTAADGTRFGINGAARASIWNFENQGIIFGTNNTKQMTLDSLGVLTVNQYIIADSLITLTTTYADDVFESDYNFMTLENKAIFWQTNKHLPALDSQAKLEDNNYRHNATRRQEQIVRELEELYIYVDQLRKEIEILKSK